MVDRARKKTETIVSLPASGLLRHPSEYQSLLGSDREKTSDYRKHMAWPSIAERILTALAEIKGFDSQFHIIEGTKPLLNVLQQSPCMEHPGDRMRIAAGDDGL